jgi:pimeloyl-ACP methyl ester carboxylesterase
MQQDICIPPLGLDGRLDVPDGAEGVVLFAHGSGSSRFSPRNNFVAAGLREAGLGTFLFDLLTTAEGEDRGKVFDIPLLSHRLVAATSWLLNDMSLKQLKFGYFGASTGAAAALCAAAASDVEIGAIVSRGGRPDLADEALDKVRAPTLLIVGSQDFPVIEMNQNALAELSCEKRLEIVPGATHLFEEPGTLEQVVDLARNWFIRHLRVEATE